MWVRYQKLSEVRVLVAALNAFGPRRQLEGEGKGEEEEEGGVSSQIHLEWPRAEIEERHPKFERRRESATNQ